MENMEETNEQTIAFELHRDNIHTAENVLFPLIAVLGILANAFVILVIVVTERSRSNRTVANTFVLNLAIADVLFLIALPLYTPSLHQNGYPFGVVMCKLQEALKHMNYHSSILFLTGMSVDRYMAIVHSLRSLQYRTQRNARIICSMLWLLSIATAIPIVVFTKLEGVMLENDTIVENTARCVQKFPGFEGGHFLSEDELLEGLYDEDIGDYSGYDYSSSDGNASNYGSYPDGNDSALPNAQASSIEADNEITCLERGHSGNNDAVSFKVWQYFTFTAFFIIPVMIILFCYFKIWKATAIRKVRSQKADGNQEHQTLQPNQTQPKQKLSWKQIQSKVTIMVAVLVSAFILSWLPMWLWILLNLPPGVKVSSPHHCAIVNVVVTMLAWTNSLMNPILYSITSENFRKRAMTTLFFLRYGYRRTMRMSVTRTSRTYLKPEKTDMMLNSMPGGSPKNDRKYETQITPPPTPLEDGPPATKF